MDLSLKAAILQDTIGNSISQADMQIEEQHMLKIEMQLKHN
jgi:hypothetical protein